MSHSNQLREFLLTEHGIELLDVYVGPEGVVTGSARQALEAREAAQDLLLKQEQEGRHRALERKRAVLEARIVALQEEFKAEEEEASRLLAQGQARADSLTQNRAAMARTRHADAPQEPLRSRK